MARTSVWRSALAAAAVAAAAAAGCSEQSTTTGPCPSLCPFEDVQLADTLLTTPVAFDTSVRGYVLVREASFLLSSDLDSLRSVTLVQFKTTILPWTVGTDSIQPGVTDTVLLVVHVLQRDTAAKNIRLVVHRIPALFDTSSTYATIQPYLADSTLVDTLAIPDSVSSGAVTLMLPTTFQPLPGDSGVISVALSIVADTATALGLQSGQQGTAGPSLEYIVQGAPPNDTLKHTFSTEAAYATFVMSPDPGQPPSGVLAVGGIPSARGTLRMSLPKLAMDSASIVRGTLILHTIRPAQGFAHDSFYVNAVPVLRDFGVKSVLYPDSTVSGHVLMHEGDGGAIGVDITPILRFWGTAAGDSVPHTIVLRTFPEGYVLGEADFAGAGADGPQLRVTYVKRYHFGVP